MPELPEVQTVVSALAPRLAGREISRVEVARVDVVQPEGVDFPVLLTGRSIRSVDRRGKRIIFTLDNSNRFFVHLGMTGRLTLHQPADPREKHTHVIWDFKSDLKSQLSDRRSPRSDSTQPPGDSSLQLRFRDPRRFGGIWWLGDAACDAGMGPEPLTLTPRQLTKLLARTTRPIKNALLDQSVLAGLGNIYVDESLFAARIHPLAPANTLTLEQIALLNRSIKSILRRAIRHRGSTLRDYRDADGNLGAFQSLHSVYGRAGQPCRVCKRPVERIVLGGRSTHFCSNCQPSPRR